MKYYKICHFQKLANSLPLQTPGVRWGCKKLYLVQRRHLVLVVRNYWC